MQPKPSKQFLLYVSNKCIKCEKEREQGNKDFWCQDCKSEEKRTHTMELSI